MKVTQTKQVAVKSVPEALWRLVKAKAAAEGRPVYSVVIGLLSRWVGWKGEA